MELYLEAHQNSGCHCLSIVASAVRKRPLVCYEKWAGGFCRRLDGSCRVAFHSRRCAAVPAASLVPFRTHLQACGVGQAAITITHCVFLPLLALGWCSRSRSLPHFIWTSFMGLRRGREIAYGGVDPMWVQGCGIPWEGDLTSHLRAQQGTLSVSVHAFGAGSPHSSTAVHMMDSANTVFDCKTRGRGCIQPLPAHWQDFVRG